MATATATITTATAPAWPGTSFLIRSCSERTPSATAEDLSQELVKLESRDSSWRGWNGHDAWMACQHAADQMARAGDGRLAAILRRAACASHRDDPVDRAITQGRAWASVRGRVARLLGLSAHDLP